MIAGQARSSPAALPGTGFLPEFAIRRPSGTIRRLTVKPAMCGHNSLFVGQLGDWTWETVSALCDTDVFDARTEDGWPAYLAFYYFHIRGSADMHLRRFTFGDRLEVLSQVFGFGSESVLTLHRVEQVTGKTAGSPWFTPAEFYDRPRPDCLYVQNFNRWVTRGSQPGNEELRKASPATFRHEHLACLPERYSPRAAFSRARWTHTFREPGSCAGTPLAENFTVAYPLDVSRDFNGVGLVYFAAYFAIFDWALLRLWRRLGRSERSFMDRILLDQKVCYLGNADVGATLDIVVSAWPAADDTSELVDMVIRRRGADRIIAVCTMRIAPGAAG